MALSSKMAGGPGLAQNKFARYGVTKLSSNELSSFVYIEQIVLLLCNNIVAEGPKVLRYGLLSWLYIYSR